MELKRGYKNTEIGVIPDNWGWDTLGNSINEMTDYVAAGSFDSLKENVKVYDTINYAIYVRLHDLRLGLCHRKQKYIDKKSYKFLSKSNLYGNEILMANIGANVGETLLMPEINIKASIAPNMIIIRSDDKIVSNKFLFYYTQSDFGRKKLFELIAGSGHPKINKTDLKKLLVIIPPLPEQSAIATVLSDTDSLIQALEKKIAKKHLIKKGAMQKLLTPKEGWERIRLSSYIEVSRGGSPRPIQNYITSSPDGINWIKIGDTSPKSKYITESKERIIPDGAKNSREVKVGDFLLSNSMSFGRPYIMKINGCIHDGWLVLHNYQNSFDREFLYYTLMSEDIFNQYLTKASGSGVLNLNKELVKTIELNRPKDIKEQVRIAQILSDMDSEIESLQNKLDKYKQVKVGMMQNLLIGKIRLV